MIPMQARKNNAIEGGRLSNGSNSVSKPIFLRESGCRKGKVYSNYIIYHILCEILS